MRISLRWPGSGRGNDVARVGGRTDYRKYRLSGRQLLKHGLIGLGLCAVFSWFFYHTFWAIPLLSPILLLYLKRIENRQGEERRQELAVAFRDMILSVASGLQAGYSVENAFAGSREDVVRLHGESCPMTDELDGMLRGVENHIPLEQLLLEFGTRSGERDIEDFAEVFAIAKRSGGNMNEMIRRCAQITSDKIDVKREIHVLLSSRRYEQRIMNVIPFLIMGYLQLSDPDYFAALYGNLIGVLIMTACLAVYLAAYYLSEKIVDIPL